MNDELVRKTTSEIIYTKRKPLIPTLTHYLNDGGTINSYVEYCLELMGEMSIDELRMALIRFHTGISTQINLKKIPYPLLVALNERCEIALQAEGQIDDTQIMVLLMTQSSIMQALRYQDAHNEVERIISTAPDESKEDLKAQIEKMVDTNNEWQSKFLEIEQARQKAQEHVDNKTAEREAFKERWTIWKSFLERESVSTIVGAFALIVIIITLTIATFTHTVTPQILDNGFLVLLGYFFGQTTAKTFDNKNSRIEGSEK